MKERDKKGERETDGVVVDDDDDDAGQWQWPTMIGTSRSPSFVLLL